MAPRRSDFKNDPRNLVLNPNQAGQQRTLSVTGGDPVQGIDLEVQIGDGTSSPTRPTITAVNVISGTIFAPNNTGQSGAGFAFGTPTFYEATTTTSTGTIAANGIIATVTFDTTGFSDGVWALKLAGTRNGDSDFPGAATTIITNGSISVPEPGTFALLLVCAVPLAFRRRRSA